MTQLDYKSLTKELTIGLDFEAESCEKRKKTGNLGNTVPEDAAAGKGFADPRD